VSTALVSRCWSSQPMKNGLLRVIPCVCWRR